ncbi:hypothetical protein [Algibacter mikhailovii]|uniref:Uncharacterized protein n=1 Tax=Algibacter mikhailovii TaxID=425498 RepID=A0A918V6L6_9FLAO|nr:hypothetical protein [Algibacter mikhailovii]GGZ73302.1 hypothetical protein GCM10007028_08160 [Algibacter mikhailovii]
MNKITKLLLLLVLISCKTKAQSNEQTDPMAYCSDDLTLTNLISQETLKISTACNQKSPELYTKQEIKAAFYMPLFKEVNKPVDEDTGGGNETYESYLFKDSNGYANFTVYDHKIPEFFIKHSGVTVKLGSLMVRVGDYPTNLKSVLESPYLGHGYYTADDGTIYLYIDYNVLSFGIKDSKIKYIAFQSNAFI